MDAGKVPFSAKTIIESLSKEHRFADKSLHTAAEGAEIGRDIVYNYFPQLRSADKKNPVRSIQGAGARTCYGQGVNVAMR